MSSSHALGEVKRSTRRALMRCARCGAVQSCIAVNIPVGCPEPIEGGTCGWIDISMCTVAREEERRRRFLEPVDALLRVTEGGT